MVLSFVSNVHSLVKTSAASDSTAIEIFVTFQGALLKGKFLHLILVWESIKHNEKTPPLLWNTNAILTRVKLSVAGEPMSCNLTSAHDISLYFS